MKLSKMKFWYTVGHLQSIFMEHDNLLKILMIFSHKRNMYNFDLYNVFLAIAINVPQIFKTAFVLQRHIC